MSIFCSDCAHMRSRPVRCTSRRMLEKHYPEMVTGCDEDDPVIPTYWIRREEPEGECSGFRRPVRMVMRDLWRWVRRA